MLAGRKWLVEIDFQFVVLCVLPRKIYTKAERSDKPMTPEINKVGEYFLKKFVFGAFAFLLVNATVQADTLISPNKKIKITVENKIEDGKKLGSSQFKIDYFKGKDYVEVLPFSSLGLVTAKHSFAGNLRYSGESKLVPIHDKYKMITGKKKLIENFGNQKSYYYINDAGASFEIIFRAYNDGVAFKYKISASSDSSIEITDELTAYSIPATAKRWLQEYVFYYEAFYPLYLSGIKDESSQEWAYPALFETNKDLFLLISEANLNETSPATRLTNKSNHNAYKVHYPEARDEEKSKLSVMAELPWESAWRVLMVGELKDIVSSTLTTDVSDPDELENTDWIKPGAASWIYWANNRGSKDYRKLLEYVDLAVEMEWPYTLIDWEWDAMTNGGNIEDIVRYANSKGIKPLMWYNSGTSWLDPTPVDHIVNPEKRKKTFAWLNEIGVYGIKVDFFPGDQQDVINYYIEILKDAAKHELLVNFHGATIQRGWQRTYPNLMTVEGVYGAEWYNNVDTFTDKAAAHNATLPFTRNVIGSMDYTPVTFTDSQHPHITSYAHELALAVIFESGLQHFADRPSGYYSLPKEPQYFLKSFPVVWDDTILLDGYPGEFVLMARRHGEKWYVAGINGSDKARTFEIYFPFLKSGEHQIKIIKDGEDEKKFATQILKIKKKGKVEIASLARGGFVAVIE